MLNNLSGKRLFKKISRIFESSENKEKARLLTLSKSVSSNIGVVIDTGNSVKLPLVKEKDIKEMTKLSINKIIFVNNKAFLFAENIIKKIESFPSPNGAEIQMQKLEKLSNLYSFTDIEKKGFIEMAAKKIDEKYKTSFSYLEAQKIKSQWNAFRKKYPFLLETEEEIVMKED